VAVFIGLLSGMAVALVSGLVDEPRHLVLVFLIATAAAAVGWLEDLRGVRIATRAKAQIGTGVLGGLMVWLLTSSLLWGVLGVFVIVAYTNIANFMDGINGISGLHGFTVGIAYAFIGAHFEQHWMVLTSGILAVAYLGFLPWNRGAKVMFLGDIGSYLLGGSISIIAVLALAEGVPPMAIAGPVMIYLVDTSTTLLRRVLAREKWYESHRTHSYHRLEDRGLTHLQIAIIVTGAGTATSVLGIVSAVTPPSAQILCGIGIALVCSLYLTFPSWVGRIRSPVANTVSS
jgi:UDP-N-acetylmuramyl pentapeptide phosphotransferase/UDP-N-acetylglucosamine-1-phosphate transferase